MKIISLIVCGLPATLCLSVAFSFIAADNSHSPKNPQEQSDAPQADLNGDGLVDSVDLDILQVAVGYGSCDGCPEDLNHTMAC